MEIPTISPSQRAHSSGTMAPGSPPKTSICLLALLVDVATSCKTVIESETLLYYKKGFSAIKFIIDASQYSADKVNDVAQSYNFTVINGTLPGNFSLAENCLCSYRHTANRVQFIYDSSVDLYHQNASSTDLRYIIDEVSSTCKQSNNWWMLPTIVFSSLCLFLIYDKYQARRLAPPAAPCLLEPRSTPLLAVPTNLSSGGGG